MQFISWSVRTATYNDKGPSLLWQSVQKDMSERAILHFFLFKKQKKISIMKIKMNTDDRYFTQCRSVAGFSRLSLNKASLSLRGLEVRKASLRQKKNKTKNLSQVLRFKFRPLPAQRIQIEASKTTPVFKCLN